MSSRCLQAKCHGFTEKVSPHVSLQVAERSDMSGITEPRELNAAAVFIQQKL